MLISMNKRMKGWITWTIAIIAAAVFGLLGIETFLQHRSTQAVTVIKINGTPVTDQELDLTIERFKRDQMSEIPAGLIDRHHEAQLRQQVLNEIIVNTVLMQQAEKIGLHISSGQLNAAISQIPFFQEDDQFSPQRYWQMLNATLYTPQSFSEELRQGLLVNQLRAAMIGSAFALPNELQQVIELVEQTRDFRYLIIPMRPLLAQLEPISEQQAIAYYQKHADVFTTPEEVQIDYIQLNFSDVLTQVTVTEQDISEYSQNQSMDAAQRQQVVNQIKQSKAQQQFATKVDQLAELTFAEPDSLASAGQALNLPIRTSDWFTIRGQLQGVLANPQVVQTAFSEDVLTLGHNSDVIQVNDNTVVVLRNRAYHPSEAIAFAEIKPQIEQQLQIEAAKQQAKKLGQQVENRLRNGQSIDDLLKNHQWGWQVGENIIRNEEQAVSSEIVFHSFQMPLPSANVPLPVSGIHLVSGDYAVIELKAVNQPSSQLSENDIQGLRDQIENNNGMLAYELYTQELIDQAKIKRYE
ncbi:MAG: hypothetical protein GKR77_01180 [Legionellales bacterium]|nr:hypothetical protein [Legionellales bacterium]